ncbi:hypothetical protein B0T44_25665 [Nocardia donostiensis]|uniref:Facilitated glucose transporter n=1 Tax=Nocardia donostiensis TaxID=1538463 RepID=A0A1V2TMS2_9NOCA|nr:hypothetical protein B0T46_01825 [Nocardia donostiensis]OQS16061.1 hypothetical protein B0T44_25665 [Nocardia donostiensis]OQS17416.1 hypothetical protein B0T36_00360 [Nocardia donostiensis]
MPGWLVAALGVVIIIVLMVDAVITLIVEVLYLPLYLGSVAFPVSALLAGLANMFLVRGAATVSARPAVLFLPIAAWTLAFLGAASTGPGGDAPLGSDIRTLLLFLFGLVPPLIYLYIQANRVRAEAVAASK